MTCAALADLELAPVFTDHAVLQRGKPLPIWGQAEPGEKITVAFAGQSTTATTDTSGRWIVYLEPLTASCEPTELIITGKTTVRRIDILVGDVWLCSGQSNMEWPVELTTEAAQFVPRANLPLIRHLKIQKTISETPADKVADDGAGWRLCTPNTANWFSAVGFYFAQDLQPRIGVPIGLINCTWGGTQIESWMSPATLASDPLFAFVAKRRQAQLDAYPALKAAHDADVVIWETEAAAAKTKNRPFTKDRPWPPSGVPGDNFTPSCLYNGMVNPLTPTALCGILWYQGETNTDNPAAYHTLFSAMITYWRKHFGQDDLPFLWVQLANYKAGDAAGTSWAILRDGQTQTLALPATGQAVIIDIGNPDDIHPRNKLEVGRRLALLARAKVYGGSSDYSGPVFTGAVREGAALRLSFDFAGTGLTARDKPLAAFEIAGADKKFYRAIALIERDTIIISNAAVKEPVAVRYAWCNAPEANLYNGAGLPAVPFRSDNW